MTICDYHMVMIAVRIAELKSKLSEHLRTVRRGQTVTVLDRNTPVARIVPYDESASGLTLRAPAPGAAKGPNRVKLPPPLRIHGDVVALLMEERETGR